MCVRVQRFVYFLNVFALCFRMFFFSSISSYVFSFFFFEIFVGTKLYLRTKY